MAPNLKKQLSNNIWVEAYRPPNVKSMVLPKKYMEDFLGFVSSGQVPNLLFYSASGGTGKTTVAKALCNDLDADMLYINISKDSGIDTLRNTITKFACTKSLEGKQKIIVMDEFDGAGPALQKGLRADIEQYSSSCRFFFTANYVANIIPQLRSRVQEYNFNFTEQEVRTEMLPNVVKRVSSILKSKNVEFEPEILQSLVEEKFPDIRKTIQLCQQYTSNGRKLDDGVFTLKTLDDSFIENVKSKKINAVRKYVIEQGIDWSETYSMMFNVLVPVIDNAKKPQAIQILAQYQHWDANALDKELNFAACICALMSVV
jgi:DNA polymerase III delta prime subunit